MTAQFRVAWPSAKPTDWRDYDTERQAEFAAGEMVKSGRVREAVIYRVEIEGDVA